MALVEAPYFRVDSEQVGFSSFLGRRNFISLGHGLSENLELQILAVGGVILVHTEFLPIFLPARGKPAKGGDLGCDC